MPDGNSAFTPNIHPRQRLAGAPVIYVTARHWNEREFRYHERSGVVRVGVTADDVRATHNPPFVYIDSVRPL